MRIPTRHCVNALASNRMSGAGSNDSEPASVLDGAVFTILSGDIIPNMVIFNEPSGQTLFGVISILLSTIRFIALPLGCTLIGAGLIMRYMRHLHDYPFLW
jgi:hypothetical protein